MPSPAIDPRTGEPLDREAVEKFNSSVANTKTVAQPFSATRGAGQFSIWVGIALMVAGALLPTSAGAAYSAGVISAEMLNWRMISAIAGAGMFAGGCALYGAAVIARALVETPRR